MAEKQHLINLHLDLARAQIAKAMAYSELAQKSAISAPCLAMEYDYYYMEAKAKAVHHIITARKIRKERKTYDYQF